MASSARSFDDKFFRVLIQNSTDAIQIVTAEGTVLYSSDSVQYVIGYTPKEIEGVNVAPYIHPDDMPLFSERFAKVLAAPLNQAVLEYRIRHKNGEWVWVETRVTNHLETPDIHAIVGNFRNITDRKKIEERLRESESQYRQLSDFSPIAVTVHAQGKILYLNKAGAAMIGAKRPEDIVGQPIVQFVHPDYRAAVAERVRYILESGKPTPLFIEKFVRLDGGIIDVEVISLPIVYDGQRAVQVVIRDITEQKRAEERLRDSEQRLRFMAESMPQKVYTTDGNGDLDYVNPQWVDYTGIHHSKLLKTGLRVVTHPDDLPEILKAWDHSLATGEPFSAEMRYLRHDGTYRWHVTRALAMRDENGKVIRWFGSNTDIEDVKASIEREHSLEQQRLQLLELNKTKDEFIALASHQLRTPATAVRQFLGMALQGFAGELTDTQRVMLESANESNNRQINIINDLLQVARLDGGKIDMNMERIKLAPLIHDAVDELRETLRERGQTIGLTIPPSRRTIVADPIKLRMVVENLLSNASKYSYEGGSIDVIVTHDTTHVRIDVEDHGVGIAKASMDKLFKKFSRIDNPLSIVVGGTGLGLYWAQKVVELHGGEINVASKIGKGSTFSIVLPVRRIQKKPAVITTPAEAALDG